jgi:hypothetical protein
MEQAVYALTGIVVFVALGIAVVAIAGQVQLWLHRRGQRRSR